MSKNTQVATHVQEAKSFSESLRSKSMQLQLQQSLPKNVSIDKFTATTATAISVNPDLLKADRQSLYNAIVKCAAEGLLPDNVDATLQVYRTNEGNKENPKWVEKVQYMRMVGGIIKQFAKAGVNAYVECVYKFDHFERWNDDEGQHLLHKPVTFGDRGELIGVYAVAKQEDDVKIVTMSINDIDRARAASKSPGGKAWSEWYDRMAEKSALHRLRKRVGLVDDESEEALKKLDDEFEDDAPVDRSTGEIRQPEMPSQPTESNRPKALQNIVDASSSSSEQGPEDVV